MNFLVQKTVIHMFMYDLIRSCSVCQRIRDQLVALTASERKAGCAQLANYPLLGLETVAEFAALWASPGI